MPHLIIEASEKSLFKDQDNLLLALNNNLLQSNEFEANDIKSRLYIADQSLVGLTPQKNAFIAATLKIIPGRSSEMKQQLINSIINTLQQHLQSDETKEIEITVELLELHRPEYRKFIAS